MKNATTGITLVALVVTIVVLLILAGITLTYVMGDNSIFQKAVTAKEKTQTSKIREQIELVVMDWWMGKQTNPNIGIDDFWDKLIDAGIIEGKQDVSEPEKDGDNDVYIVDTKDGGVVEIIVTPDGNIEIGEVVLGDKLPPKVGSIKVVTKSSNSISVQVTVRRLEEGKLSYYYKKEDETEYHKLERKQNTEDLTAEFTGLEQNKIYNIKVVAKNKIGTDEKVINELTGELVVGVISQKGETTWSKEKGSIELETKPSGLKLEYQVNGIEGKWLPYDGPIGELDHKDTVYARITDGVNSGEVASIEVRDGEAPTVTITRGNVTTNSIAVTASSSDAQWGMPTSPSYSYFIKKSSESTYSAAKYTGTNTSYTFTGLTQNTSYDIKVTTKDKAGNNGEKVLASTKTGTVGGASGNLTTGNIVASSPTWSGGKASITLSTTTNLQIQWQKNGISGTWTTGTSVTGLNHNDTVYARLWDGTNGGSEASVTIKDGTNPTNATITLGATSANTGVNVTAKVTHNDAQSGVKIASCKWVYNTTSGKIGTAASSYTGGTFSSNGQTINLNASSPGTYYLHVLTTDNAGNVWETVSSAVTVKQLATGITVSPTSATINVGATKQLTATVTPSNASNKGVTWTSNNTSVATVSSSGLVTAKAVGTATITVKTSDGSNKSATCSITVQYPAPAVSGTSTGSHTAATVNYTWDQINKIAIVIANASSVTGSTTEVTATINGSSYKIGVGDIATVTWNGTSKRVRVLGFKHDDLVNTAAYGGNHTKASISFEFLDCLGTHNMNGTSSGNSTNANGWAATEMRTFLEGSSGRGQLSNNSYIKQVKKKYIKTYSSASSVTTSNDYLWLLSASEVLKDGYNGGDTRGYAITKEGEQYLYYQKNATEMYSSISTNRVKYNNGSAVQWWLRSPHYFYSDYFCYVRSNGYGDEFSSSYTDKGVAPGFCI